MKDAIADIVKAIDSLDIDAIVGLVEEALKGGLTPEEIIKEGISKGLEIVGNKFEAGEYFLAELVMAGELVKEAMPVLKARMNPDKESLHGKVILATVAGDIHEIGKNIVGMILSANGFEVIDLGVDVPSHRIIDTAKATGARLIGLSALLTTMVVNIRDVAEMSTKAGLRDAIKIVIGGACTSEELCREMGADAYGETAIDALRIFISFSKAA